MKEIADEVRSIGKPALEALTQLAHDDRAGQDAVDVLVEVGTAAVPYLVELLNVPDEIQGTTREQYQTISDLALDALVQFGQGSVQSLREAVLSHKASPVRRKAASALGRLGAIEALIDLLRVGHWFDPASFDPAYAGVEECVIQAIGSGVGEPALDDLTALLEHADRMIRRRAAEALSLIGQPALHALSRALGDEDGDVFCAAAEGLTKIGGPAVPRLVQGLDDARAELRSVIVMTAMRGWGLDDSTPPLWPVAVMGLEDADPWVVDATLNRLRRLEEPDRIRGAYKAIIDHLVIRESQRPDSHFNATVTAEALQALIKRAPRLHDEIQSTFCEIAHGYDAPVRARAISVARELSPEEFAARVKSRALEDPSAAADIMRQLGGSESTAFFTELQTELQVEALQNYNQRLQELEEIGLRRWEELTAQTRWGFYINMGMGIGLFVVGTGIIIWGLVLLTRSDGLAQQVGGGVLSAVAALATTYSGRFWKDPVQHVQRFSAQQARVQAAFIGYMNRIGQLRLAFEHDYTLGNIDPDTAERYQQMLNQAIDQVSQQLTDY